MTRAVRLLRHGLAGQVQPVEQVALGKQRRFRRVDVLGRAVGESRQDASAESDRTALHVADGKQHPPLEAVVEAAGAAGQQADHLQDPCPRGRAAGPLKDPTGLGGREPQVKFFDALRGDAAVLEIFSRRLGLRQVQQAFVILPFGPAHGLVEGAFVGRRRCSRGRALRRFRPRGFLQGDAGPIGQHGQGLGEFDPLGLHDEAEDIAADVADPTLERLPLGIDLQAGARVVMPGAEADVAAALAAELDHAAHQVDDVDGLPDLFLGVQRPARRHCQLPSVTKGEFHFATDSREAVQGAGDKSVYRRCPARLTAGR